MRNSFKRFVAHKFPRIIALYRMLRITKGSFSFTGWGMTTDTTTQPPWNNITTGAKLNSVAGFNNANEKLQILLDRNNFHLSQFSHVADLEQVLTSLKWRHYFVYWTALYAARYTKSDEKNLVECGVADGMTAWFSMEALENTHKNYKCYLYDSWAITKEEYLSINEKKKAGAYSYLNIESTAKNLNEKLNNVIFNQGYIPNIFPEGDNPSNLIWLHIDLNSALATLESLEFFFDKIVPHGIVLFDDYANFDHLETKKVVDNFFATKNVELIQLPTGQAFVIKA